MQHEGLVVDARKLQRGRSAIGLRVKGLRRLRCDGRFVLPQGKPPWSFAQRFGRTRDYGILDVIDLIRQQRRHVGTHPRRDGAKGVRLHDAIRGHGTPARRNGEVGRGGSSGKAERTAKDGLHPLLQRRCGLQTLRRNGLFLCGTGNVIHIGRILFTSGPPRGIRLWHVGNGGRLMLLDPPGDLIQSLVKG